MKKLHLDGVLKNAEVVVIEWKNWWRDMSTIHWPRFRKGTWRGKENYFHLATNLLEETIEGRSRTWTYGLILWGAYELVRFVGGG